MSQENVIWTGCFVSHRTQKGMVSLRWKDNEVQLSIDEARDLATNLARVADAAEMDEMCLALFGNETGPGLIGMFRDYREVKLGIQKAEWTPAEITKKLKNAPPPET